MDTSYWRYRLATQKSSVSVEAVGSRLLMLLLSVKSVCFPQNSGSGSVAAPSLVNFTSESSSVTLEWRYDQDDQDHPAFITGYLVTVHEAQQDPLAGGASAKVVAWSLDAPTPAWCSNKALPSPDQLSVRVADPRTKAVTIDGLQHNREYVFSLSALTRQGPGQATSISIRTRPDCERHHRHGCGRSHGVGAGGLNTLLLSSPL